MPRLSRKQGAKELHMAHCISVFCIRTLFMMELVVHDVNSDFLYRHGRGFHLIALILGKVSNVKAKNPFLIFIYDCVLHLVISLVIFLTAHSIVN